MALKTARTVAAAKLTETATIGGDMLAVEGRDTKEVTFVQGADRS